MIKATCFTNIDGYKHDEWPDRFVAVPREGEWVQSKSGKTLTVVKVAHGMRASTGLDDVRSRSGALKPYIRVELH
jgi:hypothetical protein